MQTIYVARNETQCISGMKWYNTNMVDIWSKERIKSAFDEFIKLNGRLPTAPEIDRSSALPSSRQIQRKFGGLRALRKEFGYDVTDLSNGVFRSQIAKSCGQRGLNAERLLEEKLIDKFGELFVHTEKLYGPGKNRVDFFVYTQNSNFGIDVFTTETVRDLQKNINIKIDKYLDFPSEISLYFVLFSKALGEAEVASALKNMSKLAKLPNLSILTLDQLYLEINKFLAIDSPKFISLHRETYEAVYKTGS